MWPDLGEYNEWSLLFLGGWGPGVLTVLVILGLLVFGLSWYDLRDMRPHRRWTLVALRVAVYLIAVALLLEPALELKNVTKVKNHIAVLVDSSLSQTLKVGDGETRRIDRATTFVREELKELLTTPNDDHIFDVYTFDSELTPSSYEEVGRGVEPRGDATRTIEAIEEVANRVGRRDLGGFVLLSDGIDSGLLGGRVRRGELIDRETSAFLERLDVPIHALATASSEGLKDLSVESVQYDDFAFVRNSITIDVTLRVVGFEPRRIPVVLKREGQLLQTREVEVGPDNTEYRVTFEFVPQQIGKEIYTVSTPHYENEALTENNRKDFVLKVIRDKIRALQVVGRPSWDERFLRQLLKQNPNVDLISFFILRTAENAQVVPTNELSLIPFPTRELFEEELGSFDIVIFQNFNFRPYGMSQYLRRIADYVRDGGGFVMIGGELSFTSGGYAGTPLSDILPVMLPPPGNRDALLSEQEYNLELTDAGMRHPITQLAFEPALNRELWAKLPPLEGTNLVFGAKPGATVLGYHPKLRSNGGPLPVVTVGEAEKGRVMAVTTDSTWKWSFHAFGRGGTSRPYHAFWNSAIRWLIKDPELKLLQVKADQTVLPPGGKVGVSARVVRADYAPAEGVKGTLEVLYRPLSALDGPAGVATEPKVLQALEFTTDAQGRADVTLPADEPGAYTVRASARTESGNLVDEDIFLVTLDSQELRSIEPREPLLKQLAEVTQGTYERVEDADDGFQFKEPRVVRINRRKVIDVWDTLYVLLIICSLLGSEWMLRRRWGRL
ncbi:MAG: hypothetical protein CMH57_11260 [Myxococcales bacterium]|nr:hypothetical protein [Myxococcales bacterium]